MAASLTSAAGVIALLDEDEPELRAYALQTLNSIVDLFWAEISDSVSKIEVLYEDPRFPNRELAALVASKVYFYLGEFDEALAFALGAGSLFDISKHDEYVETVISKAIEKYIALRSSPTSETPIDPRLKSIVDQMFSRCIADKEYRQALGIALEARQLEVVEEIFNVTKDRALLQYTLDAVMTVVQSLDLRNEALHLLVRLFQALPSPDHFSISQCFVYLNSPSLASQLLLDLVSKPSPPEPSASDSLLIAYQLAFDFAESATQEFLENMREQLGGKKKAREESEEVEVEDANPVNGETSTKDHIERIRSILSGEETIRLYLEFLFRNNHADLLILKNTKDALDARNSLYHSAVTFANAFMHAGTTSDKFLRESLGWLAKASNWSKFSATAALGVIHKGHLALGRQILEPYLPQEGITGSVYSEGGSLFALGLIHANHGQGVQEYLKNALKNNQNETLQHGAALGLAVASMATGNEEIYEELRTVLYSDSAIAGEAAGYAMGLVMLGTASEKALDEMLQYAHETQHEKIIRGLAMGIAMLMYGCEEKADGLIDTLMGDKDPILRYGGIYTVAMAYAGSGNNKAIRRLLHVAVSDVSDDVRRAAVTAVGFLLFRNPTQVPRIVQLLSESYNPHVRYGATLALGIACAGTGLDEAIDLLEPMTKDPVDFVRQGAFISLAMILIQQNEVQNPRVSTVRSLYAKVVAEKHEETMARFGAALAQGIIDAGGRNVTIGLQAKNGSANMSAIVGMAMFTQFWYWFPLAHFASLAFTPTAIIGVNRDLKIPEFEFISKAKPSMFAYPPPVKPPTKETVEKVATAVLSTTAKAQARQRVKEREKAEKEGELMDTDEKVGEKSEKMDDAMKTDEPEGSGIASAEKEKEGREGKEKKRRAAEPSFEKVPNLSRVTPAQLEYVSFPPDSRYLPVRPVAPAISGTAAPSGAATPAPGTWTPSAAGKGKAQTTSLASAPPPSTVASSPAAAGRGGGILVLVDQTPGEPAKFLELKAGEDTAAAPAPVAESTGTPIPVGGGNARSNAPEPDVPEAEMPEPFEYPFDHDV